MSNQKWIGFKSRSKWIVKSCVECHHKFWKRRHSASHDPELQKKFLKYEVLVIAEEVRKKEVEGLRRHDEVHCVNVSTSLVE